MKIVAITVSTFITSFMRLLTLERYTSISDTAISRYDSSRSMIWTAWS